MIAIAIPKTHYSTISYARLVSVDMPFADAHRGTPFGQKNGPAIAIAAAAGTIGAGVAAGGLLGGLMIAGGVMSGLGAITGNKTLSTIGGIASLAGGLGTAFTASEAFSLSAEGVAQGISKGDFINPFTQGFGNTQMGQMFTDIGKSMGISGDSQVANALEGASSATNTASNTAKEALGTGAFSPTSGESALGGGFVDLSNSAGAAVNQAATTLSGASKAGGLLSTLNDSKGLMDLGLGLANGFTDGQKLEQQQPLVDAQTELYDARTDSERFALEKAKQQQANMQYQNAPVASVNQDSSIFTSAPNQAPKIAVNVGGAVRYVTQAEYDQYRAQQNGGLLQQGATA